MKSAPCCCNSLRSSSLVLLYFNLALNAYTLLYALTTLSPGYMNIFGMQAGYILIFILLLATVSCLIFLFTIIAIYKKSASLPLLTASICILLLSAVYSICVVISWTIDGKVEKELPAILKDGLANLGADDRYKYKIGMGVMFTPLMVISFIAVFIGIVFQLYSAFILHSYKENLKETPFDGIPPAQNNPDDKEADVSAPYPQNTQFVTKEFPSQLAQYLVLPPQYPYQLPQYALPTQNYPQAHYY